MVGKVITVIQQVFYPVNFSAKESGDWGRGSVGWAVAVAAIISPWKQQCCSGAFGHPLRPCPTRVPVLSSSEIIPPPYPQQACNVTEFLWGPVLSQMLQQREIWQMNSPKSGSAPITAIYSEWPERTAIDKDREMHFSQEFRVGDSLRLLTSPLVSSLHQKGPGGPGGPDFSICIKLHPEQAKGKVGLQGEGAAEIHLLWFSVFIWGRVISLDTNWACLIANDNSKMYV